MRLQNSGHNCIAGQVVILSRDWPQREAFLAALHSAYADAPERPVWYPRSDEKLDAAASAYPDAEWCADHTRAIVTVPPADDATAVETTEYFAPVLGIVELPGNGQEFLDAAVAHANERLAGTLGANVLIDPVTEDGARRRVRAGDRRPAVRRDRHQHLDRVRVPTPILTWGAFPGGTLDDV